MEGNPPRLVREHQARRDHELREIVRYYPNFLVSLKVDARLLQELDGFRREHVFAGPAISNHPRLLGGRGGRRILREKQSKMERKHTLDAEMKIELPCRHVLWVVAVFVGKREADLDDLEQVHVTAHRLIVVV